MLIRRIKDATNSLGSPKNWDTAKYGPCITLPVRRTIDGFYQSAWEPSPEELRLLNEGGSIILSVFGGQPPVMLSVEGQE